MAEDARFPTLTVAGYEFVVLQIGAIVAGAGLILSYALPWIAIVGQATRIEGESGRPIETIDSGTIAASEIIAIYPDVVPVMGAITIVLSIFWWNRITHLLVTAFGLGGIGIILVMRELLKVEVEGGIRVADYVGPPSSFELAIGMWAVFLLSAMLVGVGFGGLLNTFEPIEEE
jgi:hypothetical protein